MTKQWVWNDEKQIWELVEIAEVKDRYVINDGKLEHGAEESK
jgi:hypothetical protein